ncbi:MAG: Trk system potassium transporter TrkA [Deltaproteobacteria bacterium]|nr:Trk system potassium transporter TrkA [Deltaproteobacteria bacterium]
MKVLIIGAGEVGYHLASHLAGERQDVVVLDREPRALKRVQDELDVQTVLGSGSNPDHLKAAGIESIRMVIAVTDSDEVNVVACLVATRLARPGTVRIARIREESLASAAEKTHPDLLGIDRVIHPEKLTAEKIVKLLPIPAACDLLEFEGGKVQVLGLKVDGSSPLAGKKLHEVPRTSQQEHDRILYGAILRHGQVIIPRGDTTIVPGDTLYAVIRPHQLDVLLRTAAGHPARRVRHVIVAGGTPVASFLARSLAASGIKCKMILPDEKLCEAAAAQMNGVVVLHGESTDRNLLEQEFVGDADAFVGVGRDDEENILSALLARQLGVARNIVVTRKASYISLLKVVGVDVVISPRLVAVSSILGYIRRGRVVQGASLGESAEALEYEVPEHSPLVASPLKQLSIPRDALIVAVVRQGEPFVPGGKDHIEPGDRVLVFALRSAIPAIENSLGVRRKRLGER